MFCRNILIRRNLAISRSISCFNRSIPNFTRTYNSGSTHSSLSSIRTLLTSTRTPSRARITRSPSTYISSMPLVTISQSLDESYTKHKIVPDVIDKFDTEGLLTIEYNDEQVALGNTLKVSKTQNKPEIQFTLNSSNIEGDTITIGSKDKFILVLTDPDAPSNSDHKWSEYAHWIISDLTFDGPEFESLTHKINYSKGNEILSYQGPAPPPNTGKHRYVFLLYKQDPKGKVKTPSDRPNWGTGIAGSGVRDWIKQNLPGLKLLGVNFFYAQNEEN